MLLVLLALPCTTATYFMTHQWRTESQVAVLTNCFGFPSAPWVNYESFKYFVPAEYSTLSGVYCVEI